MLPTSKLSQLVNKVAEVYSLHAAIFAQGKLLVTAGKTTASTNSGTTDEHYQQTPAPLWPIITEISSFSEKKQEQAIIKTIVKNNKSVKK